MKSLGKISTSTILIISVISLFTFGVYLLYPKRASAAIAFVQSTTGQTDTNPLAMTAFAGAVTAGNYIIVTCGGDSGVTGEVLSITDDGSNTYSEVTAFDTADGNTWLDMWYVKVVTGGSAFNVSVTFDDLNTNIACVAQEFSGLAASSAFDVKAVASGS